MTGKDDNDRLRDGTLPIDPTEDATPMIAASVESRDAPKTSKAPRLYVPFPVHALPEPLRSFVAEAAMAMGCDPAFVSLPLLAGLAAAIGNTRRIQLKRRWFEPAVLWTAIVGESGTLKSPALQLALEPLKLLQLKAFKRFDQELAQYKRDVERNEIALREWRKHPENVRPITPRKPTAWRIVCANTTIEALAPRLVENPRGLLMARDELAGWVNGFDQYKGGKGGDAAQWLELHRAGDIINDRKTGDQQQIYIPRAAVSVTGGIQPGILRRVLGREHFENGLAARLLLAMPPRIVKVWRDDDISVRALTAVAEIYDRLLALDFGLDDDGDRIPVDLPFTEGARKLWIEFYNAHAREQVHLSGDLAAAWSKLEGYAARLALIIHLVRWQGHDTTLTTSEAIDERSIEAAVTLTRWFAREAERVYAALEDGSIDTSEPDDLEVVRRKGGRVAVRGFMHASRKYRDSAADARRALDALVAAGHGHWEANALDAAGERHKEVFVAHDEPSKTVPENGNAVTTGNGNTATPPGPPE